MYVRTHYYCRKINIKGFQSFFPLASQRHSTIDNCFYSLAITIKDQQALSCAAPRKNFITNMCEHLMLSTTVINPYMTRFS